jgi:hypothetical protein
MRKIRAALGLGGGFELQAKLGHLLPADQSGSELRGTPDPKIPAPTNTQDYNRYAYVDNNPLTLVDPAGFDADTDDGDDGDDGGGGGGGGAGGDGGDGRGGALQEVTVTSTRIPSSVPDANPGLTIPDNIGGSNYPAGANSGSGTGTDGNLQEVVVTATKPKKPQTTPQTNQPKNSPPQTNPQTQSEAAGQTLWWWILQALRLIAGETGPEMASAG